MAAWRCARHLRGRRHRSRSGSHPHQPALPPDGTTDCQRGPGPTRGSGAATRRQARCRAPRIPRRTRPNGGGPARTDRAAWRLRTDRSSRNPWQPRTHRLTRASRNRCARTVRTHGTTRPPRRTRSRRPGRQGRDRRPRRHKRTALPRRVHAPAVQGRRGRAGLPAHRRTRPRPPEKEPHHAPRARSVPPHLPVRRPTCRCRQPGP